MHQANPDYDMNERRYLYRLMLKAKRRSDGAAARQVSEISRYSLLTVGAGMPAGASRANQVAAKPDCCGRRLRRLRPDRGFSAGIALVRPPGYLLANGLHLNLRKGSPCDPNF
jgi:hypothetical protein